MSAVEDRKLLKRLGVEVGRPDTSYTALLALARRTEQLEARLAALEGRESPSLGNRGRMMIARALGRA